MSRVGQSFLETISIIRLVSGAMSHEQGSRASQQRQELGWRTTASVATAWWVQIPWVALAHAGQSAGPAIHGIGNVDHASVLFQRSQASLEVVDAVEGIAMALGKAGGMACLKANPIPARITEDLLHPSAPVAPHNLRPLRALDILAMRRQAHRQNASPPTPVTTQ